MAQQLSKEEVENRKDAPHQSGSELGVSSADSSGSVHRVGKTQFANQGGTRPEAFASVSPIYGNQMLMDMEMLEVQPNELKATDLGEAYTELFSLSQKYPGLNPKAYLSNLDVQMVDESEAAGTGGAGGGVLYVQWSPQDLESPTLSGDLDALQNSDSEVHAALNPSWTGLQNLVDSGRFNSIVISGHGQSDAVSATDDAGLADTVTAEELLSLLDGSTIQNVVLSATEGSMGLAAMGAKVAEAGMRVMNFMEKAGVNEASASLGALVEIANQMGQPGFSGEVFKQAAAAFDASGGALVARLLEFEAGNAGLEDIADMLDAFIPQAKSKIEELGSSANLDTIAEALSQSSEDNQQGDVGKAIGEAESSIPQMTVSMGGADLVEDMA